MRYEAFHRAALALRGAVLDIKWGADRVYTVGEKMFAAAGPLGEEAPLYSFKVSDMAYALLVEQGVARPAPYLARARWVQLVSADALPDEQLTAYLSQAHAIVAAGLTRTKRVSLGL